MSGAIAHTNFVFVGLTLCPLLWAPDGLHPSFAEWACRSLVAIWDRLAVACAESARSTSKRLTREQPTRLGGVSVYPKDLCDVQVLIGADPAGLFQASEKQINFKVPQDSPESWHCRTPRCIPGPFERPSGNEGRFREDYDLVGSSCVHSHAGLDQGRSPIRIQGPGRYPFALGPDGVRL